MMTLQVGCTPSINISDSPNIVLTSSVEQYFRQTQVMTLVPATSDRLYCEITYISTVETKYNGVLTPKTVVMSRLCKANPCFEVDVVSTSQPCALQFKVVTTFHGQFNHTSAEHTISILPSNQTIPNMAPFLAKAPGTQMFFIDPDSP